MTALKKYDKSSNALTTVESDSPLWEASLNAVLLHQAVVYQQNQTRVGTACTKTRSEVRGGGKKPWKQKGTGRARAGSRRSPLWRGGGTSFGPKPRSFDSKLNRKVAKHALASALSAAAGKCILAADDALSFQKTADAAKLLAGLQVANVNKVLVIAARDTELLRATRNIPNLQLITPECVGPADLLKADAVVLAESSLETLEKRISL